MSDPVAYFITFTTYGTWLHRKDSGSVDREHNLPGTAYLPADAKQEQTKRGRMRQPAYTLDEARFDGTKREEKSEPEA